MLALFVLNAPSLAIGFWNAALGFALLNGARHPVWLRRRSVSAATTIPSRRERRSPWSFERAPDRNLFPFLLKTLVQSLDQTGHLSSFDFFILSDSDQPDVVAAEEAAFASWRAQGGGSTQVFYRRRKERAGFKPGNVYDFCESDGRKYDLLVLLDSDSLMSGEVVVRLVRTMQANSRLGILQTFSVGLPSESLFARIFSFGHRHGMRCAVVGAAWWQGDCGQFWGHDLHHSDGAVLRALPVAVSAGRAARGSQRRQLCGARSDRGRIDAAGRIRGQVFARRGRQLRRQPAGRSRISPALQPLVPG